MPNVPRSRLRAAALLGALLLAGTPVAGARTLLFADFGADRGPRAAALRWFAAELERRSGGTLTIRFHWGGALLGANAALQGTADGVADLASITGWTAPRVLRGYNLGDLPSGDADIWVGMRAMHALATTHPELQAEFARAGVVYLTNYSTGPIQLLCTRELPGLAALARVKVRGSGPYARILADLGARVQRMAQPEVYQALAAGLLDCNQNYYYGMLAYRQYEVASHVLELDWGQNLAFGVVMNAAAHARLSAAERRVLAEVASDFVDDFAGRMVTANADARTAMLAGSSGAGITVTPLGPAGRAQLAAAGERYIERWLAEAAADGRDGAGILAAYRAHLDSFARERDALGYPWTR